MKEPKLFSRVRGPMFSEARVVILCLFCMMTSRSSHTDARRGPLRVVPVTAVLLKSSTLQYFLPSLIGLLCLLLSCREFWGTLQLSLPTRSPLFDVHVTQDSDV
ncbi:hypothetical protein GH733_016419 [Mirounga leonina]|nr:hypothetical protein GH733_016419 [Mirounga leonina]